MPRERTAMSPVEVARFLAAQRWVVLGTLDPDGSPWADLAACTLDGERLFVRVGRGTRSQANLERDPRACCSIDRFPSYYEIQGVTVHGRARREEDAAVRACLAPRFQESGAALADPTGELGVLYSLPLDDVFSFDFGKIRKRI